MKKYFTQLCYLFFFTACISTSFADNSSIPNCDTVVQNVNQVLNQNNAPMVTDSNKLVSLLHSLNTHGVLPSEYVTEKEAKESGWKGTGSLWNVWLLNKKILGGDLFIHKDIFILDENKSISLSGSWFSADIDAYKGNPSSKKLIFSPGQTIRYITTDTTTFMTLSTCQ